MVLKPTRHIEATVYALDRRSMGVCAVPTVATAVQGGKDAAVCVQGNSDACGDRTGRLGITRDARKLGGTPFLERIAVRFEAPVRHGMGLTGLGMVAKDVSPKIVGDGVVARPQSRRLAILPHIADIDHRLNRVLIPETLYEGRCIVSAIGRQIARGLQRHRTFGLELRE